MTRPFPLAFYLNSLAMGFFFAAIWITQHAWHLTLQWAGGVALVCGIILLIMRK